MPFNYIGLLVLASCIVQIRCQTDCKSTPSQNIQALTQNCRVDVGRCSGEECYACHPLRAGCCTPLFERTTRTCPSGEVFPYFKVFKCKCLSCNRARLFIGGTVSDCGSDCGNLIIKIGEREVTRCNEDGTFSFSVERSYDPRIVLIVIDESGEYFPNTGVVDIVSTRQAYYGISITVSKGSIIPSFPSNMGTTYEVNDLIFLTFPSDSFVNQDGSLYNGVVKGKINLIDPSDHSRIPAPLIAPGIGSGPPRLLSSYGMLQLQIMSASGDPLKANGVRITVKIITLSPDETNGMDLWILNLVTGLWEEESSTTIEEGGRKKRQLSREFRTNITGPTQIRNLDVLVRPYCFVKVRIFGNEAGEEHQIADVKVPSIYGKVDGTERNYILTSSNLNGACVPIQCNALVIDSFNVSVSGATPLELNLPAAAGGLFDARIVFATVSLVIKTNDTAALLTGPIYTDFFDCQNAPFAHYYFGFIVQQPDILVETNTVAINEESIDSPWIDNVLSWWPNEDSFDACYMKIVLERNPGKIALEICRSGAHAALTFHDESGGSGSDEA